jgi:phosphatidylserine/phosphatidylglycerophosphate/cardiolipin synthase-like enzyme
MRSLAIVPVAALLLVLHTSRATAADRLCDPAFENCRTPLLDLIHQETVGIDVGFWFMEDARYSSALIERWRAGVPVRVVFDNRAISQYGYSAAAVPIQQLRDAGVPMRHKTGSAGIFHFKTMIFAGQNVVEFSAANFSAPAFAPIEPYVNYVDEVIAFSDDPSLVNSFKTRFDDVWTDQSTGSEKFADYANVVRPLERSYPTYAIDPELNFVPWNNFRSRSLAAYREETAGIDSVMYRITDRQHTDELIRTVARGVPVRLISEPQEYRNPGKLWDSWNVDRLYMAGVQVRMRHHAGLTHEKLTVLRGQQLAIFGSSNWTSASATGQHEHNIFTRRSWWYTWFADHFDRKWNNAGPSPETEPFVPLPPDTPVLKVPAGAATNQPLTVTLKWYAGKWAHKYDVYFGTDPSNLTRIVDDRELGPSESASDYVTWTVSGLADSTTYYWQVTGRTMANLERTSDIASFRTQGAPPASGGGDVVLHAWRSASPAGWSVMSDPTAAGGRRLVNANARAPKLSAPLASPTRYFELQFSAAAGVPYRLWIRGKAENDSWANDSVYVQFSDSVTSSGGAVYRIGSTSATVITIEDCANCGLSGWGWQDNGYGAGVLGPEIVFASSGTHTVRVQVREDGLSIDQVILSPSAFLTRPPGALRDDGTIYAEQGGTVEDPPTVPTSTLPGGWSNTDVGATAIAGSAEFSGGTFRLDASGADVWGTADAFHYAYRSLDGDGSIVARVASVEHVAAWTKAGVMMRASLEAGSPHAFMLVSPGKGLAFQRRVVDGGLSTHTTGGAGVAPAWVKLTRSGTTFSAYRSADGSTWTPVGSDTIAMGTTIYVGIALNGHSNSTLATGVFDSVTIVDAQE